MLGLSWPELHGAVTHFPVALLLSAALFASGAALLRKPEWRQVSFWLLALAVITAVPTLLSGWKTDTVLFAPPAHPPLFFPRHRLSALITAGLALLLLLWRMRKRDKFERGALAASLLLMCVVAAIAGYTGYLGGKMVFGGQGTSQESLETTGTPPKQAKPGVSAAEGKFSHVTETDTAGANLFQQYHCLSCHRMNGTGATAGPDLTHEAQRHADITWQIAHLKDPFHVHPDSAMPSFGDLPPQHLKSLASFLASRH